MNEQLGRMLAEAPALSICQPGRIYWAVKADHSVYVAVRAKGCLTNRFAIRPFRDGTWRKGREAVKASCGLTSKQLLSMHRRAAGSAHEA
ncbi:hypothetical protein GCM10011521_16300 [Arenimonas soli]|uniref:Uncharacterized protein n=1 Tax=Arenimonas soli TaxID=2269504 RepID=A0ABQ1HI35_9GAMM|nr:hypothetical protein GCM10011521_16300 [Arenimonas soli]